MSRLVRRIVFTATALLFGIIAAAPGFAQGLPDASPASRAPPGVTSTAPAPAFVAPPPGAAFSDDNYRLGTGEKLKITVYGEDDLSGEYLVDGSGQVQFPLIGQVRAGGLTVHQFVVEITTALGAKYLRDPKISVQILNYRPFYIMGEVNKPGEYPYENGLNVLGAVALAGGFTYRADSSDVYIRRNGSQHEENLPADGSTKIYPGDIVRISERMF